MPERSGPRPARTRRTAQKRSPGRAPNKRTDIVRDRLRKDPFLFLLCLAGLASITWAFALTWWVTGARLGLAVAVLSVAPAMYPIYLRGDSLGRRGIAPSPSRVS